MLRRALFESLGGLDTAFSHSRGEVLGTPYLEKVTLKPFGIYSGVTFSLPVLIALLVCLIPTTIGGLLSAIGISGIDRLIRRNVMATSGRAVEAAGDIDVLLLDKTGTITIGNRMASDFRPAPGVTEQQLADAAQLASLADLPHLKISRMDVTGVVESPNGAHFTECPPDYNRNEALQKQYAASARDVASWDAFVKEHLS